MGRIKCSLFGHNNGAGPCPPLDRGLATPKATGTALTWTGTALYPWKSRKIRTGCKQTTHAHTLWVAVGST